MLVNVAATYISVKFNELFLINLFRFVIPEANTGNTSNSKIRSMLDEAASASIFASQRIFMARQCKEWCPPEMHN